MFLFGICVLNIHLQIAVWILAFAMLFGGIVYGTGIIISLLLRHMEDE